MSKKAFDTLRTFRSLVLAHTVTITYVVAGIPGHALVCSVGSRRSIVCETFVV